MIGRTWSDQGVQADRKHFLFAVKKQDGKPVVSIEVAGKDRTFSSEEISAMLGKMKNVAKAYLGKKVNSAVVTGIGASHQSMPQEGSISANRDRELSHRHRFQ